MNMPQLGLGTFRLQGQQVIDSVRSGLDVGYRHIDTAQIYENEAEVGQTITESGVPRSDIFLTTKIWTANLAGPKVISSLKESLVKLRTEQLDLTLIHWPGPADGVPLEETLLALLEAKHLGMTAAIGLSNFTVALMQQAIAVIGVGNIMTNQVELHPFLQQPGLVGYARKSGIHLTAYMPLAYGKVMQDPSLQSIATALGVSPAQVSLAWLMKEGFTVIPSSTRRSNQEANFAALRLELSERESAAIRRLNRNERMVSPDFALEWDE
jgi:2,5-diketo-D-gluconate reductase B